MSILTMGVGEGNPAGFGMGEPGTIISNLLNLLNPQVKSLKQGYQVLAQKTRGLVKWIS